MERGEENEVTNYPESSMLDFNPYTNVLGDDNWQKKMGGSYLELSNLSQEINNNQYYIRLLNGKLSKTRGESQNKKELTYKKNIALENLKLLIRIRKSQPINRNSLEERIRLNNNEIDEVKGFKSRARLEDKIREYESEIKKLKEDNNIFKDKLKEYRVYNKMQERNPRTERSGAKNEPETPSKSWISSVSGYFLSSEKTKEEPKAQKYKQLDSNISNEIVQMNNEVKKIEKFSNDIKNENRQRQIEHNNWQKEELRRQAEEERRSQIFSQMMDKLKGEKGQKGPSGPVGERGDPGEKGAQGPTGATGKRGEKGDAGEKGPQGPAGAAGKKGEKGDPGEKGPQGPAGAAGKKGEKGDPGEKGAQGPEGPAGPRGEKGPQGPTGKKGSRGDVGEKGEQGPEGKIGPAGPRGEKGPVGERGAQGAAGAAGKKGERGDPGKKGPQGPEGAIGPKGEKGDRGEKGPPGPTGARGPAGELNEIDKESLNFLKSINLREIIKNAEKYTQELKRQEDENKRQAEANNIHFSELQKWQDKLLTQKEEIKRQIIEEIRHENEAEKIRSELLEMKNENEEKYNELKKKWDETELKLSTSKKKLKTLRTDLNLEEAERVADEDEWEDNEEKRIESEKIRISNEKNRISEELFRIENEKKRVSAELSRTNQFSEMNERLKNILSELEDEKEELRKQKNIIFDQIDKHMKETAVRFLNQEKMIKENKKRLDAFESIPLKDFLRKEDPVEAEKEYETFFMNDEDTTGWIKNRTMRDMTIFRLQNIDEEEKKKDPQIYRNALLDSINEMEYLKDSVISWEWEGVDKEEKIKFNWEQKIKIFNEVFAEKDVLFLPDDKATFRFFQEYIEETYTPKTKEHNGYTYKGTQIIKRTAKGTFKLLPNKTTTEFLKDYSLLKNDTAYHQIANEVGIFTDNQTIADVAEEYVQNLREEQKNIVNEAGEAGEFFEMVEFNEIENEIQDIRNNRKFKLRAKVWAKSFGGYMKRFLSYLKRILKRHWLGFLGLFSTLLGGVIGTIYYQKSLQKLGEGMKKTAENLKNNLDKLKNDMKKYLGDGFFNHIPDIAVGILGFILTYTGKLSIFAGNLIFTPLRYFSLFTTGIIAAVFTVVNYFFKEDVKYAANSIREYSYFMNGEFPPQNIATYFANEENITVEEYKKKYYTENELHHSFVMHILSYPTYVFGYMLNKSSDVATKVTDFLSENLKYLLLIAAAFLLMYILIKWRT